MNHLKINYNFFTCIGGGGGSYGIDLFSNIRPKEIKEHGTCKGEFQVSNYFYLMKYPLETIMNKGGRNIRVR